MRIYFAGIFIFMVGFFLFILGAPLKEWETALIYKPTTCTATTIFSLSVQWKYGPKGNERYGISNEKMATLGFSRPCFYLPGGRDQDFLFSFSYSVAEWVFSLECMIMSVLAMAGYPVWRRWQKYQERKNIKIYHTVMMQ